MGDRHTAKHAWPQRQGGTGDRQHSDACSKPRRHVSHKKASYLPIQTRQW